MYQTARLSGTFSYERRSRENVCVESVAGYWNGGAVNDNLLVNMYDEEGENDFTFRQNDDKINADAFIMQVAPQLGYAETMAINMIK